MNKFFTLSALRLMPKSKQQQLFIESLNSLLHSFFKDLQKYKGLIVEFSLKEGNFSWNLLFDGTKFVPSDDKADIQLLASLNDLLGFQSIKKLVSKINNEEIVILGKAIDSELSNKAFCIRIIELISPLKLNHSIANLRDLLKIKDSSKLRNQFLTSLSISDINSESDVDFLREQAVDAEKTNPYLAYRLMFLAHGARPEGPFIKAKLEKYRQLGFDKFVNQQRSLSLIPVVQGQLGYFPVPRVGGSFIKAALYQCYDENNNHADIDVDHFWSDKMEPMDSFRRAVIVIRDPIERFLSAYASLVLDNAQLEQSAVERVNPALLKRVPYFNPSLSQFIEHLDTYMYIPSVWDNCQPFSQLINQNLSQFTDIFTIEEMPQLEALFSEFTENNIQFPQSEVSTNKVSLKQLTEEELNFLLDYYNMDYQILSAWFTKESVHNQWKL